jgi:large subunit ribosomal protein L18
MGKQNPKAASRIRRHGSIRKSLSGTAERPRLAVFRSARQIYAQVIDDVAGTTLASASSLSAELKEQGNGSNKEGAKAVGQLIATKCKDINVSTVVFDRGGFRYHGRVAALADAAREAGLVF